jgi:hypothetical protein
MIGVCLRPDGRVQVRPGVVARHGKQGMGYSPRGGEISPFGRCYRRMVSGTPPSMRCAIHVMAEGLTRTQPCETADPSAPERLLVP